jgi:hypothetical protein
MFSNMHTFLNIIHSDFMICIVGEYVIETEGHVYYMANVIILDMKPQFVISCKPVQAI